MTVVDPRYYDPAHMALPQCAKGHATVTADTLNVRQVPGTAAVIVGKLARGTLVDVWAVIGAWYLVQDATGLTGWCSAEWLQVNGRLIA